jgi:hypothetical protein
VLIRESIEAKRALALKTLALRAATLIDLSSKESRLEAILKIRLTSLLLIII